MVSDQPTKSFNKIDMHRGIRVDILPLLILWMEYPTTLLNSFVKD